jgi:hypothetical protein
VLEESAEGPRAEEVTPGNRIEERVAKVIEELGEEEERVERGERGELGELEELDKKGEFRELEVSDEMAVVDEVVVMEEVVVVDEVEVVAEANPSAERLAATPFEPLQELDNMPEEESAVTETLEPGEPASRDPRWVVGAALSPLYSFRDAESGAMAGVDDFETGMIAYAGGVQVSYRIAGRFSIESGVFFNKMGISIGAPGIQLFSSKMDFSPMGGAEERSNVVAVSNSVGNIVSKSGDIYVNNYKMNAISESNSYIDNEISEVFAAEEGIEQHLDYLELPFNLRYTVIDRAFELQLVGGMSTNFLVNNYVTMDTPSGPEEIGYLSNIKNVNYSGNAGIGMIYHIHKKISLSLEPRFRYFLNSVNDATLPSTRPYSLGLYTGVSYTF